VRTFQRTFGDDARILRETEFQILLLAGLMAPLGPSLVSPMLDSLTGPFGTSEAAVGLMISAFTAPGILLIPLAGSLADRYGRKLVMIVWAGPLRPGWIGNCTDDGFPNRHRPSPGPGGRRFRHVTRHNCQYWRYLRWISRDNRPGVALHDGRALTDSVSGARWRPRRCCVAIPVSYYGLSLPIATLVALWFDEPARKQGGETEATLRRLTKLVTEPHVLALLIVFITSPILYFGFLTYISILVRLIGGTPGQAGIMVAINSIAHAIAASQSGRFTAHVENRLVPLLWTNAAMGIGIVAVGSVPNLLVVALGSGLFGIGFGITLPLYRSMVTSLAPQDLRASLVSLGESIIRTGSTGAPLVMSGAVAVTEPELGFATATRLTVCVVSIGTSVAALGGLVVMSSMKQ